MKQEQFLNVITVDEAHKKFDAAVPLRQLEKETIAIDSALGRITAETIIAAVNVPAFDRSNFDGFAVQAADIAGADESHPAVLRLVGPPIKSGRQPDVELKSGMAVGIATGAMIPRGADAILMVEFTSCESEQVSATRSVPEGFGISYAGSDICCGQTVIHPGTILTSRECGVIAAIGNNTAEVVRRPRVAIISTGNEIVSPGQPITNGQVYDSNSRILCDAARELGAQASEWGIAVDEIESLRSLVQQAVAASDIVVLSGGTSKGPDDISYRVVSEFNDPGIIVHGVAVKPGKPICLSATQGTPVVVLPGFPTSAIFMFHEFVAPLIRKLAGRRCDDPTMVQARLSSKVNSVPGRTEYNLVRIANTPHTPAKSHPPLTAFPMGKGSGSVTTFGQADGFFTIDRNTEFVEAGDEITVRLISKDVQIADLVIVGSHCPGLDLLVGELHRRGLNVKQIHVGSTAGLDAAKKGWCDLAGIHLFDPVTDRFNLPFLDDSVELIPGYTRKQGIVVRHDASWEHLDDIEVLQRIRNEHSLIMTNRNSGSGTRILIDRFLDGSRPAGYTNAATNHHAIAAAVEQRRADWGVCISSAVDATRLRFVPLEDEKFDFVVPVSRVNLSPIQEFRAVLANHEMQDQLARLGYRFETNQGG